MMTPFRPCRLLLPALLLLLAGAAPAQQLSVSPLGNDPGRALFVPPAAGPAAARVASLALPFFDDFTSPLEGTPRVQHWMPGGGALVNNRFAILPPTRGTASLDGLQANGRSYSGQVPNIYGTIDSLTSQAIDLSGQGTNDRVALSFAWQAGSVVGVLPANTPSRPVRLELFVRTNAGLWESVWMTPSLGLGVTGFKQQVVLLDQARYLHGSFQFRFIARGNTSTNSTVWNVDYVLLDRGRTAGLADTTFADAATGAGLLGRNPSGGLRSPLRRFTAMPVWQFNAAPAGTSELNNRVGVNLVNLRPGAVPLLVGVKGLVRDVTTGTALGLWRDSTYALGLAPHFTAATGNAARQPVPTTPPAKVLRYTLALNTQETTARTLPNDTISRDVSLGTYFAYDDGTAEAITALPAYATGQPAALAYRVDLNQPDHVRGLRLYPVFTPSSTGTRLVTINVWDDVAGRPAAQPRVSKSATIPNPLPAGWEYLEISFDVPVAVTGTFYVGYTQPSTGIDQHYGFDLNSNYPAQRLWLRDNVGVWDTAQVVTRGAIRGALMMRPVMSNNVATATAAGRAAAAFSLYPNPAHGPVSVAGPAFARAAVLDAVGRTVWTQPAAEAGRPTLLLPTLPPGSYLVRLTLPDGSVVGQRLLLE